MRTLQVAPATIETTSWLGRRLAAQLVPDLGERLGLDRQQDDVRVRGGLEVGGDHAHAVLARRARRGVSARGSLPMIWPGPTSLPRMQAGDDRLGHDAGADRGDGAVR